MHSFKPNPQLPLSFRCVLFPVTIMTSITFVQFSQRPLQPHVCGNNICVCTKLGTCLKHKLSSLCWCSYGTLMQNNIFDEILTRRILIYKTIHRVIYPLQQSTKSLLTVVLDSLNKRWRRLVLLYIYNESLLLSR